MVNQALPSAVCPGMTSILAWPLGLSLILAMSGCNQETDVADASTPFDAGRSAEDTGVVVSRCDRIRDSVVSAGFGDDVEVRCDDSYAYLVSDTYPDHDLMNGILGTNEQVPVEAVDYASPVRLEPSRSGNFFTHDASLGVAVNGVPIYDYSAAGELDLNNYNPNVDTLVLGQLDNCGGHAGRGDDYHYHVKPTCMIAAMDNAGDDAIIGWAFDGYPLYGDRNPDGSEITAGTLDICNGQADEDFGYRYHTSEAPPYVWQCLVGAFDSGRDFLPRVPPLTDASRREKPAGMPVPGGADSLSFVSAPDGTRRLNYAYGPDEYYVQYTPSGTPNCYNFEFLTVSFGMVQMGEYCR